MILPPPAEKRPKRLWLIIPLFIVLLLMVSVYLMFDSYSSHDWKIKTVSIPPGSSLREIDKILSAHKILPYPFAFRGIAMLTGTTRKLHFGEYTFPNPPSAIDVWRKMLSGDVVKHPVIVRPGSNLFEVARILEGKSLADREAFLAAATSPSTLEKLGIEAHSAEGYLVPDTYNLIKNMKPAQILDVMVRRFKYRFTPEMAHKAAMDGLSVHEVVTIASIIEKETRVARERPLVSSVIRNRLRLGMPLQMDPTVIYEAGRFDGRITRKDLRDPGPYNTYTNRGLPPGPIANPGLESLLAALNPAETDYLYFASNNDGTHTFSKTMKQHSHAVKNLRKLQKERAAGKHRSMKSAHAAHEAATPQPPP